MSPKATTLPKTTQLETTQAAAVNVELTRAKFEHAIAVLTGRLPSELTIADGEFTTVLAAFQSVEDDLVSLRVLAGVVAYSSVITVQTSRLADEISLLSIQSQALVSSVDLISQLGGGWDASQLERTDRGRADEVTPESKTRNSTMGTCQATPRSASIPA